MKAIIFATHLEADFAISAFGFRKIADEKFDIFLGEDCVLAISGIGILSASLCVQYLLKKFTITKILNVGACGALTKKEEIGEVFEIGKVICADHFCDEIFAIGKSNNTLISSSCAIKKDDERAHFAKLADFVDMECYGILKAISISDFDMKNFSAIKVVSDFSEGCDIKKNIVFVIKNLEPYICDFLK